MNGIIFDLDGTLWDTSKQVLPAWNTVLDKYNRDNISIVMNSVERSVLY